MMTVVSRPTSGLVALSAGGTGGHLFPAEALAQELPGRGFRIHLYTDRRVNRLLAGFPCEAVHEIASATFTARPSPRTIAAMARLVLGFFQARRTLRRTGPVAVVGFGGYPTLPPLLAALTLGLPTVILEQNAVVGRANRLLARLVRAVATGFSDPLHLPRSAEKKLTVTGNPVREAARAMRGRRYEQPAAGGELRLVVFGGSQGASVFADVVPAAVADLPKPQRLRIVQQCRPEDLARVNEAYANHGIEAETAAFFPDLPHRIADAHLVIARAGASTIGELAAIGRPAILVPLPHSLDNDQLENARRYCRSGCGWLVEQDDFTPGHLGSLITRLWYGNGELSRAAAAAARFGEGRAEKLLADLVEGLVPGDSRQAAAPAVPADGPGDTSGEPT